jgi:hypothetical protein
MYLTAPYPVRVLLHQPSTGLQAQEQAPSLQIAMGEVAEEDHALVRVQLNPRHAAAVGAAPPDPGPLKEIPFSNDWAMTDSLGCPSCDRGAGTVTEVEAEQLITASGCPPPHANCDAAS